MPTYVTNCTVSKTEAWEGWVNEQRAYSTTTATNYPVKWVTSETTGTTTKVWTTWQQTEVPSYRHVPPPPLSPQEQARRDLIARSRRRSREVRQRNAQRRARRLLLAHLSEEQRAEWEEGSYFHVETAGGRRRYRIERGHVGNVRVVQCDEPPPVKAARIRVGVKLCAHAYHPEGPIPEEDHVLAQKLLLESEGGEAEFLTMANVS